MVGVDISGVQPDDVPGNWEFVVVKSTEGNSVVNPRVGAQWANAARTTRGLYHYARPALSSGTVQATVFAGDALKRGFRPGVDLWQLDCEDGENDGVSDWPEFIDAFMAAATSHLGTRGFLYAGWPFVLAHGLQAQIRKWKWWLPDYGPNDGQVHPFGPGVPANLVVIHQYTSHGGLDQNRIVDPVKYAPTPVPAPSRQEDPMLFPSRTKAANVWSGLEVRVADNYAATTGDVHALIDGTGTPIDVHTIVDPHNPIKGAYQTAPGKVTIVKDDKSEYHLDLP